MIVQLFLTMTNRFAAVFRNLYHKMAAILFTLRKLTLCVASTKFSMFFNDFHRETFYLY